MHPFSVESCDTISNNRLRTYGFLSPPPTVSPGPPFNRVSQMARELPELIGCGAATVRRKINSLPLLDVREVCKTSRRALMRDYLFLQSAYVHVQPEEYTIPASIAVPSHILAGVFSEGRGVKSPMLSYASVVLDNWELIHTRTPLCPDNVRPIVTFSRLPDEIGFLMIHILIEGAAGQMLAELSPLMADVSAKREEEIIVRLKIITQTLGTMRSILLRMSRCCDPHVYYEHIRPWLAAFQKVLYEGVEEYHGKPQSFVGASGAQSSVFVALDAALCIRHERNYFSTYIEKLRDDMPPEHLLFIEQLEKSSSLRAFVCCHKRSRMQLRDAYNTCLESVRSYRIAHRVFALRYIHAYSKQALGTGGTPYEEFLQQYIRDTAMAMV